MNWAEITAFEIDFLPVGDGERSGDAIAMRWQQPDGFYVAVVDGGTKESGERLVEHVRTVYGATFINLVINTHPDQDHSSGLSVVLERMPVLELWMHRPWAYPEEIKHLFANGQFTTRGLAGRIKAALDNAYELEQIARRKQVPIVEPFQGTIFGPLLVLSPPRDLYLRLIPHFNNTPKAKGPPAGILGGLLQATRSLGESMAEAWGIETLREDGTTSAQNESSVVLCGRFGRTEVLLTADAGQLALLTAAHYALSQGIRLDQCVLYQVPHHGSRRNVSPSVLTAILGPPAAQEQVPTRTAFASVAANCETHPRKVVTNAFLRRGVGVSATKGRSLYYYQGYPRRPNYDSLTPFPFYTSVEAYD